MRIIHSPPPAKRLHHSTCSSLRRTVLLTTLLCAPLILFPSSSALAQEKKVELHDYVVQPNDTCMGIAARELGDRKAYKLLHQYNDMGPSPHTLIPGTILRLPGRQKSPDAKIASAIGSVQFRKATEPKWSAANLGQDLYRAWRVWSKKESTAVVTFRDSSVVAMRENTVIVIYGPKGSKTKKRIVRAQLESGSLRTRLAKLSNLVVETETSIIEVSEGSSIISADGETKSTTVSNHRGGSLNVRSRKKKRSRGVAVAPGKGTWVDPGKAPAPPRDLPAAPAFAASERIVLGLAAEGISLKGSWNEIPSAEKYRIEISIDPTVRIVVAAFEVPKTVTSFEAQGLEPREYYLSVSAIDDKGLESVPSEKHVLTAVALEVTKPDGSLVPSKRIPLQQGAKRVISQGSLLVAPKGYQCGYSSDTLDSNSIPLLTTGHKEVFCKDSQGNIAIALPIEVPALPTILAPDEETRRSVVSGSTTQVDIASTIAIPEGTKFTIQGTNASLQADVVHSTANRITLQIKAAASAKSSVLELFQDTAAGPIFLANIHLDIAQTPDASPSPVATAQTAPSVFMAAIFGTYSATFEDNADSEDLLPFAGLRLGFDISSHLGIEAEVIAGHRSSSNGTIPSTLPRTLLNNRLLLTGRFQPTSNWTLRARIGASLWSGSQTAQGEETKLGAIGSVGLERAVGPVSLRVDLDGYALADTDKRIGIGASLVIPIN